MKIALSVGQPILEREIAVKRSNYGNLRRSILTSMIFIPLVTLILILGFGYYFFITSLQSTTIDMVKRIVADHRHMIDAFLKNRKADLDFVLDSYSLEELADPETLAGILSRLQKESNAFLDLGLFNSRGIHMNYQGPYKLAGKDYAKSSWFKEVMQKGEYISDVFLGYRRIPHFVIALKREMEGKTWIIRSTIDTQTFNDLVEEVRIGKTGEAYLLNADGIFQTGRRSGGSLMERDPEIIEKPPFHDGIRTSIQKDAKGDAYLYAATWLQEKNWLLVVRQAKEDAFKALYTASYVLALITLVGVSGIVGLALILTNRIIRRMEWMDVEKEQLDGQLIRASRLAELGEMATGFAHEINNPLQIMKSEKALVDVLLTELKEKEALPPSSELSELEESFNQMDLQIDRCARITQSILKFGRQSEPVFQEVDLQAFIPEVTAMVKNKAGVHGIVLSQEIDAHTPAVHGDPGQLQQVLLNLYNNAIDAILQKHGVEGGKLTVGAGPREGGKAFIFVQDNGSGIAPADQKKIFSPFFTTKPVGKGTGLGLSVCYGIIGKMGGFMEVESEKGVGTTFNCAPLIGPKRERPLKGGACFNINTLIFQRGKAHGNH